MGTAIEFTLNGRQLKIEGCSPNTTLLEYLRAQGLTGSKEGCAEGDCGACSVAIIDRDSQGRATYRAINSCLVPICLMAGREIVSVEGVAVPSRSGQYPFNPLQSQRDCALQPRVGEFTSLPWVGGQPHQNPERVLPKDCGIRQPETLH